MIGIDTNALSPPFRNSLRYLNCTLQARECKILDMMELASLEALVCQQTNSQRKSTIPLIGALLRRVTSVDLLARQRAKENAEHTAVTSTMRFVLHLDRNELRSLPETVQLDRRVAGVGHGRTSMDLASGDLRVADLTELRLNDFEFKTT